jgi:hypothetical protein
MGCCCSDDYEDTRDRTRETRSYRQESQPATRSQTSTPAKSTRQSGDTELSTADLRAFRLGLLLALASAAQSDDDDDLSFAAADPSRLSRKNRRITFTDEKGFATVFINKELTQGIWELKIKFFNTTKMRCFSFLPHHFFCLFARSLVIQALA